MDSATSSRCTQQLNKVDIWPAHTKKIIAFCALALIPFLIVLHAFDLTADLGEDDHFSLVRQGNVRLALKFADALANTVTVIAYAEFENVLEIDRDRNVLFDFGV